MIEAQEVSRRHGGGVATGADDCVDLVEETSHADVRFALNDHTNGVRRSRSVRHHHRQDQAGLAPSIGNVSQRSRRWSRCSR